jgi:hypothetical protein
LDLTTEDTEFTEDKIRRWHSLREWGGQKSPTLQIPRLTYIEKRIPFSKMRFVPGDGSKQSLKARGLNFEMIIEAIATNGIVSAYHRSKYPSQVVLIVNINGYMHCVPCEHRGEEMRLITAWPSRKYQKKYL